MATRLGGGFEQTTPMEGFHKILAVRSHRSAIVVELREAGTDARTL
jgi:hypothetical protein